MTKINVGNITTSTLVVLWTAYIDCLYIPTSPFHLWRCEKKSAEPQFSATRDGQCNDCCTYTTVPGRDITRLERESKLMPQPGTNEFLLELAGLSASSDDLFGVWSK